MLAGCFSIIKISFANLLSYTTEIALKKDATKIISLSTP